MLISSLFFKIKFIAIKTITMQKSEETNEGWTWKKSIVWGIIAVVLLLLWLICDASGYWIEAVN